MTFVAIGVAILFTLIAAIYSSVGLAGGSSYLAVLAWLDLPPDEIRWYANLCNLTVSFGSLFVMIRRGLMPWRFLIPMCAVSMPLAFGMAKFTLTQSVFLTLLSGCLGLASFGLLFAPLSHDGRDISAMRLISQIGLAIMFGVPIGALAGLTGIGGGIYLSPALQLLRIGKTTQVACLCSGLIFLNSLAVFSSRLQMWHPDLTVVLQSVGLALCVGVGGQIGVFLLTKKFSSKPIRRITGVLILVVAIQLAYRAYSASP